MTSASLEGKTPRTPRDVRPQKLHLGDMSVASPKRQCLSRPSDQSQSTQALSIMAPQVAYQKEERGSPAPYSLLLRSFSSDLCGYSSETSRESPFSTFQSLSTFGSNCIENGGASLTSCSSRCGSVTSSSALCSTCSESFSPPVTYSRNTPSLTPPPVLVFPTTNTTQPPVTQVVVSRIPPRQPPLQEAILEEKEEDQGFSVATARDGRASATTVLSDTMMKTWRIDSPISEHSTMNRDDKLLCPPSQLTKRSLFGPSLVSTSSVIGHNKSINSTSMARDSDEKHDGYQNSLEKNKISNHHVYNDDRAAWTSCAVVSSEGLFGGVQSPFAAGTQSPLSPPELLFNEFPSSSASAIAAVVPNCSRNRKSKLQASPLVHDVTHAERINDLKRCNPRALFRSYSEPAAASTPVSSTSCDAKTPSWFSTSGKEQAISDNSSLFTPPVARRIFSWGMRARCSSWDGGCDNVSNDWGTSPAASDDALALFRHKLHENKNKNPKTDEEHCWLSADHFQHTTTLLLSKDMDANDNEGDDNACDGGIYVSPTSAFGHTIQTQSCETTPDRSCDSF